MRDIREELEQAARELAQAKAYIKKLVNDNHAIIDQKNAAIADLQVQRAGLLHEVDFLNNKLKEQSPLIDMDNMKGANQ